MRRKLIFGGMILLALALTSGTFAYTYSGYAAATLNGTIADAVMTTYQPSGSPPNWNSILPDEQYGTEIIVPNAAGDDTELPTQYPTTGEHWDKVDDQPTPDDGATYVSTEGTGGWQRDLYNLSDYIGAGGTETIDNITVYFRFSADGANTVRAMASIKTNSQVFDGTTETHDSAAFITKSYQWTNNPATGEPWTQEELDDLQAGVTMKGQNQNKPAICTQVYVQVNYEVNNIQGEVPSGDLYDITPNEAYTGDLLVKLYLTNTSALLKAYQYINMKVYVADSLEAEEDPDYRVLSMENGVVSFNIEGGAATSYTVQVSGGSYRLHSADPDDWGSGWSIEPEFYIEVTQR
ncbi:MAG: hypothetical protein A2Z05_06000 [Chloroflexi bacterium RBG_16_60_22]|nr:MAG: hypothetical protein A2Z05_06000 [Chloroflexi bacterium RBG_16_60_22]